MERRNFMRIFGAGALAAVVQPTLLFAEEAGGVQKQSLVRGVWVVEPSRKLGHGFDNVVAQAKEFVISPPFSSENSEDPNVIFYRAVRELQQALHVRTQEVLLDVPKSIRNDADVVVSIVSPISVRSKGAFVDTSHWRDEDWRGFDVVMDCSIEAMTWREKRRRGWVNDVPPSYDKVVSRNGSYPFELPGKLDLGHLMSIDRHWVSKGLGVGSQIVS